MMRHTISVLVENKFGVLARVAGMISGRGFNIDSLNVAPTQDGSLSRITIVLKGDESALDLCIKQLQKLINVVEVLDFKEGQAVARELVLVKVRSDSKTRPEIKRAAWVREGLIDKPLVGRNEKRVRLCQRRESLSILAIP